ncbi:FecR domain-containing protein [Methylobacillus sp. Pita1]|uniref:FecR family protein n=1 Tax=Methylobacillus sp. Pita1 TaxID=3382642 RepID=UPI0038B647B6
MISIGKALQRFALRPSPTVILLASSLLVPLSGMAAAGKVEFVHGLASIVDQQGNSRVASKGSEFDSGETLQTVDGRMQVKFIDGGYISLQPNTSFKVEEYHYNGQQDGSERGIFRLIKGGLRAITGVIGHANKPNYRMDTPVATIGIRGTEFTASLNDAQRLLVKVGDGAVFIENDVGNLVLYKGQAGEVGELNRPAYSEQQPLLAAAGPSGATSEDAQQDQKREQAETQSFVLGDNKSISGGPCLGGLGGQCVWGTDPSERLISAYHLAGVQGQWSGTSQIESTAGELEAKGSLSVDFSQYSARFGLELTNIIESRNEVDMSGGATGKLSHDGSFAFSQGTLEGVGCTNTCDLVVHQGQLSGNQLSDASVNFSVIRNNPVFGPSLPEQPFVNNQVVEMQRVDNQSNVR